MVVFVFPTEARHERPHVHISFQRRSKAKNIKIWLDTMTIAKAHKDFSQVQQATALVFADRNRDLCMDEWVRCHGKPTKRGGKK